MDKYLRKTIRVGIWAILVAIKNAENYVVFGVIHHHF